MISDKAQISSSEIISVPHSPEPEVRGEQTSRVIFLRLLVVEHRTVARLQNPYGMLRVRRRVLAQMSVPCLILQRYKLTADALFINYPVAGFFFL